VQNDEQVIEVYLGKKKHDAIHPEH
jgi:ABC-type uncharacterized transport system ATPase subunit